jgi:hypothetical protein
MKSFLVKWRWNNDDELTTTVIDVRGFHWKQHNGEGKITIMQGIIRENIYSPAIIDMLAQLKALQWKKNSVIKAQKYEEGALLRDEEKELCRKLGEAKVNWMKTNDLPPAENIVIEEIYKF